jgi:hypothetical protein
MKTSAEKSAILMSRAHAQSPFPSVAEILYIQRNCEHRYTKDGICTGCNFIGPSYYAQAGKK